MRWFGLDVHRDFCEVAVADEDGVSSAGRIATRVPTLELFTQSLLPSDVVALEATTGADRIVSILQRQGIRVVVANTRKLRSITEAKNSNRNEFEVWCALGRGRCVFVIGK
jgi:transposase